MLDSGTEGPGFQSPSRRCRATVLGKPFTPIVPLFTKQKKLVAALLSVVRVTAGLAESNGSLPLGLWLTSPAGWLPRTWISSGTLCSVIEYGQPLPFYDVCRSRLHGWEASLVVRDHVAQVPVRDGWVQPSTRAGHTLTYLSGAQFTKHLMVYHKIILSLS